METYDPAPVITQTYHRQSDLITHYHLKIIQARARAALEAPGDLIKKGLTLFSSRSLPVAIVIYVLLRA